MTAFKSPFDRPFASIVSLMLTLVFSTLASPYDHISRDLERADAMTMTAGTPNLERVAPTDLAGAFFLPLRAPVTPDMIRTSGDPRPYRAGIHQGVDFYGVERGSPVYPIAAGVVVRVDQVYAPMSEAQRAAMLLRCKELGGTPGEVGKPFDAAYGDVLDKLRGRQVWVYHGRNGAGDPILSIYAHLESVAPVEPLRVVTRNDIIGAVGNSGTSWEHRSDTREIHLHLEIYVGEDYWRVRDANEVGRRLDSERDMELRRATIAAFSKD